MEGKLTMVSYKDNDPKGWCGDPKRGAALGRHYIEGKHDYNGKIVLRQVNLDSGGYDCNGTYFGHGGEQIYWFAAVDGSIDGTLNARTREIAKNQIRKLYPNAKFYR